MRLKRAFPYFQPVVVDRLCGVLQYFCNVHTLVHTKRDKCRRGECMASVNRQSFMSKLYVLHDRCLRISWRTLFLFGKTASRSNINLTLLKLEMIGNQLFLLFVNLLFAFLLILYTASVLFSVYLCTVYYYSDPLIPSSG